MARPRIPSPSPRTLVVALALAAALVAGFALGARPDGARQVPGLTIQAEPPGVGAAGMAREDVAAANADRRDAAAGGEWAAGGPRRLVQTAELAIVLRPATLEETVARVRAHATRLGGYVLASSVGGGGAVVVTPPLPANTPLEAPRQETGALADSRPTRAWVTLRVPAGRAEQALAWFSRLGDVRRVTTATDDVTRQWVDLEARLRHFRAVERRLLGFLAATHSVREMLAVQDRLDQVQLSIEQLTAEIAALRETTAYATVTLDLVERDAPQAGALDQSDTFIGTFIHSVRLLARSARLVALALTAAAPFAAVLALLAGGAVWGWRRLRRSRRQPPLPGEAG